MKASEAFRTLHMGSNFMTPQWEAYMEGNGRYVEISSGRGIDNDPIYGVTVLVDVDGRPVEAWRVEGAPESKMFYSITEARAYASELTS